MNVSIKIGLINPKLVGSYPPIGLAYLASYLEKYGLHKYEIKIFDGNITEIFPNLINFNPHIVGFSAMSLQIQDAVFISNKIKKWNPDVFQIIGGIHVSAVPEITLRKGSFDIAVIGEGEETFVEIINHYISRNLSYEDIQSINGVAFLKDNKIFFSKPRKEIVEMDSIPVPARHLLGMEHYLSNYNLLRGSGSRTATIHSSRGCPYRCTFCSSKIVFKKTRYFSPEYVVDEIEELVSSYNVNYIFFTDDTFIIDKLRAKRICELIIKRCLSNKIEWEVQARAELVDWPDLDLLELMKKAGCKQLDFGFESGSDRILSLLKNGGSSVAKNQKAIEVTKFSGLNVLGTFMLGTLGETDDEIDDTKNFIQKNISNIDHFQTFIATPFPGATLYELCKEKKIVEEDYFVQLEKEQKENRVIIYTNTVSRQKVLTTLKFLNNLAINRISLKNKFIWLFSNLLRHPISTIRSILLFLNILGNHD